MWIRWSQITRLSPGDDGSQHRTLQRRPCLWRLFCHHVCRWSRRVQTQCWCCPSYCNQFSPPNYTTKPPEGTNNWCNLPLKYFKLTLPMFTQIAYQKARMVTVIYLRVPCAKRDGVKFQLVGDSGLMRVLLYNVSGAGDVSDVKIKGSSSSGWLQMTRIRGQIWQIRNKLQGQTLSFQVTTSDGRMIEFDNVVYKNWRFGETYDGIKNFLWEWRIFSVPATGNSERCGRSVINVELVHLCKIIFLK